ncbi:MAG: hypothetical protein AB7D27_05865 [Desulfomicrobium sp.]
MVTILLFKEIFNYYCINNSNFLLSKKIPLLYENITSSKISASFVYFSSQCFSAKYLFVGGKYRQLINISAADGGVVLVGGWHHWLYAICMQNCSYFSYYGQLNSLYRSWNSISDKFISVNIDITSLQLRKWGIKVVVVTNDSLPLERMWIAAARQASIPSVCIQHGLFSSHAREINDGKYADVICAYDEWQSQILMETGARKVSILGFYEDQKLLRKTRRKRRKVCFLGQPWVDYYKDFSSGYMRYVELMVDFFERNQIDWCYKPHPSEMNSHEYVPGSLSRIKRMSLHDAFRKFDVFISLSSTALLEASLAGRVAIQVRYESIFSDNMEKYGYSHSIDITQIDDVLFDLVSNSESVAYPFSRESLKKRWGDFVQDITIKR